MRGVSPRLLYGGIAILAAAAGGGLWYAALPPGTVNAENLKGGHELEDRKASWNFLRTFYDRQPRSGL